MEVARYLAYLLRKCRRTPTNQPSSPSFISSHLRSVCLWHPFYPRDAMLARSLLSKDAYLSVRLTVCLSVTRRYSVWTAKPILKLFQPSGSPVILLFRSITPVPNSNGNPFSGAFNTPGWKKNVIFDGNCRLSRKRCKIGRLLLWNVNRKSWVPDWMIYFFDDIEWPLTRVSRSLYT